MEYYWELILRDGTVIDVPPAGVEVIKKRMDRRDPIHTKTYGSIPYANIEYFRPTSKPYGQNLLEAQIAQVFNEPVENPDGSIAASWVKFPVTQAKWDKYYSHLNYFKLAVEGANVMVACRVPIHLVDIQKVGYCTPEEEVRLEQQRKTR